MRLFGRLSSPEPEPYKMTKTAIIVVSDLHINSTVAICPPAVNLDDGGTYHASHTQMWLWRSWQDFIAQIGRDYPDHRKILVINGDLGELDTAKRSIQLITLNKATILKMVWEVLDPLAQDVDRMLFLRGTAAHTGKSSWLEEATANDSSISIRQSDDVASHWHYRGVCEGVRLDIAHHTSAGGYPWTRGGSALRLAAKTVWQYRVARRIDPPHLVIRSHNHHYQDSGGNYETHAILTPAWTTATEYMYRVGHENELSDIGGIVVACENGQYNVKRYRYTPKEDKRVWTATL